MRCDYAPRTSYLSLSGSLGMEVRSPEHRLRTAERTAQPGRHDGVNRPANADNATVVRMSPRSPLVRALELWLLAVTPVVLLVGAARSWSHSHTLAWDFDRAYLPAAHLVVHGS